MIEEGTEKRKDELIWRTDLKVTVLNSAYGPYLKKGDMYPYRLKDFLDKALLPKNERKRISKSEQAKNWSAAGHAMMKEIQVIKGA